MNYVITRIKSMPSLVRPYLSTNKSNAMTLWSILKYSQRSHFPSLSKHMAKPTTMMMMCSQRTSICAYHSTPALLAPRRRRRTSNVSSTDETKQNSDENNSPLRPTPIRDLDIFFVEADKFLDKLEIALAPMKSVNEVFEVDRRSDLNSSESYLYVRLKPGEGTYTLLIDEERTTLSLTSPISGGHTYVLCAESKEFVGEEDGHSLEGMLTRDMIRHCHGVPKF